LAKNQSLYLINEDFAVIFNTVFASAVEMRVSF